MLASDYRMRRPDDFRLALRGRRSGRPTVVLHLSVPTPAAAVAQVGPGASGPGVPRVGFIVSRAVGGATTRNRVRRRLRHLLAARIGRLPAGSLLVLRALPASATASSAALGTDVDAALGRLLPPAAPGSSQ